MPAAISVLIPARDEEERIARCLTSLTWANEVVILLDDRTGDATAKVAAGFANTRVVPVTWEGYGRTKARGVEHTRNEWVFWVDADEVVPESLRHEIEREFATPQTLPDAFDLPRRTWFVDDWILHCGWYPGRVVRLFRKSSASFNDNILHEGVAVRPGATLCHLQQDLEHYSFDTIGQFFEKMVRYGPLGADEALRQGRSFRLVDLMFRPLFTFFKFYVLRAGFLDGTNGFVVCMGSAFSNFIRYAHLYYLARRTRPAPGVTGAKDTARS